MKRKHFLSFVTVLFCLLLLCGCAKRIRLSAGRFPADAAELSLVLEEGETALLDRFGNLRTIDLRGSACVGEIFAWAQAHPEVDVIYSLSLPDGGSVDNSVKTLDMSSLQSAQVGELIEAMQYLPELETVLLGTEREGGITAEELRLLKGSYPSVSFDYSFILCGKQVSCQSRELDLSGLPPEDLPHALSVLPYMSELERVDLGKRESPFPLVSAEVTGTEADVEEDIEAEEETGAKPEPKAEIAAAEAELSFAQIAELQAAAPGADFEYEFEFFGKRVKLSDKELDLNHIEMDDEGAAVREVLPCMKRLELLDMDFCGVSSEAMAEIRDAYPDVKVIWRVWFGGKYSVRTDVEKILASKASIGGMLYDHNTRDLQYCTEVKYLDIGHSEAMTDMSFIASMTKLEVCILAMALYTDCSALANCPNLEYLELQTTNVHDLTPLSELKNLKHLNICRLRNLTDISPLYGLTQLERLWIGCANPVPAEQIAEMQRRAPDCEINTTTYDPTEGGWRYTGMNQYLWVFYEHPRYTLLRKQFGYALSDFAFYWNDPLYYPHD